ncbi:MAG TPA: hypothetical protein VG756_15130 [Pseudonocardiaceae bacterium]|jgi:hypothetical protein|nr:hypothetical protein [Pseudonocardiaceae bacterium]
MLDERLLDDPGRLADADGAAGGCLRAAAAAGAQVRSTVEAGAEVGIAELSGSRPRAVVFLTRPGISRAVVDLLIALLGPACPVPLVRADTLPSWVGPLDVVFGHTDDPGDHVLAESVDRARRYGAQFVLTGPADGPVAAAAAGTARLLPPRVPTPVGFGFPRVLAAGLLLLDTLGLLRTDLDLLADELDKEAERDHAGYESFVNPAKSLALRLAERSPVLCGLDPVATAVAGHAVDALAGFAGVVATASDYAQFGSRTVLHRAAVRGGAEQDIFADPDDSPGSLLLRVVLLAVRDDQQAESVRRAATELLPGADVLEVAEGTSGEASVRAAVLALRVELAAVYLGLAGGSLGGPGRHAAAFA